jgi:hypothetical protein
LLIQAHISIEPISPNVYIFIKYVFPNDILISCSNIKMETDPDIQEGDPFPTERKILVNRLVLWFLRCVYPAKYKTD